MIDHAREAFEKWCSRAQNEPDNPWTTGNLSLEDKAVAFAAWQAAWYVLLSPEAIEAAATEIGRCFPACLSGSNPQEPDVDERVDG